MRRAVLAAVAVVLAAGWVRAADDDAVKVVEKGVKAHGGADALKKHPGGEYTVEGDLTVRGEKGKYTSTVSYALPDKFRVSMDTTVGANKSATVCVVNADRVKVTTDGKAVELKKELKAEFLQLAAIQEVSLLYPLLDKDKFTLKAEKDDKVDGKEAAVVLVSRKGAKDMRLCFDKESGRLVRYTYKLPDPLGGEADTEVTLGEFKEFSGVLQPTVLKLKQNGKDLMTQKVTNLKLVEKPDLKAYSVD